MKTKQFYYAGIFVLFFGAMISCSKKTPENLPANNDSIATDEFVNPDTVKVAKNCYQSVTDQDTAFISVEDNLGTVIGHMEFKNQKDNSEGDITGLSNGDTLKVTFLYESEGKSGSRDIWFLKKDKELIEAVGKYDASGEKYVDESKITFDGGTVYKETICN